MSKIKRFEAHEDHIFEANGGEFIRHDDHVAALEAVKAGDPTHVSNVMGLNEAAVDAACLAGLKAAVSAAGLYRKEIEAAVTAYLLTNNALCSDCPRVGHSTDDTRCDECPRRSPSPVIADTDRLKIPRLTAAWGGIPNAPEALDEAALQAAKIAMVEATGLSPMWGSAVAWAGARAAVTAYLAAISGDQP